jgi:hypothetical protein
VAVATILVVTMLALVTFGVKTNLHNLAGRLETIGSERAALALADRLVKGCELAECGEYVHSHVVDASKVPGIAGSAAAYGRNVSVRIKGLGQSYSDFEMEAEGKVSDRICSKRLVLLGGVEKILEACVEDRGK